MTNQTNPPDDGREIGSFQSLSDKMSDLCKSIDESKSMIEEIRTSESWLDMQRRDTPCVQREPPCIKLKEVVFANKFSLEKFKALWPQLKALILKSIDTDSIWTCLHHVLTFYHQIEETSFAVFMKWLNGINGQDLITDVNIRRQSRNYFCHHANELWTKSALDNYATKNNIKITTALHNKFDRYDLLCEDLWQLILPIC